MGTRLTDLDIVNGCDKFPSPETSISLHEDRLRDLGFFVHGTHTLGYLTVEVQQALRCTNLSGDHWVINGRIFSLKGDSADERTARIKDTCRRWREKETFQPLQGWRDELYPVYSPSGEVLLEVERAASSLFGIITYGVHLTAFVRSPEGTLKLWIPRRAMNKQTYGGMLDNTVAGGIESGYGVRETLIKESAEEASLPETISSRAICTGAISYFYISEGRGRVDDNPYHGPGYLRPEVQYCYDLELGDDTIPRPCDGEVDLFHLWDIKTVREEMRRGSFKPNCAVVLIDFFIRHGIITPENEPNFLEIVARIHRRLPFPLKR